MSNASLRQLEIWRITTLPDASTRLGISYGTMKEWQRRVPSFPPHLCRVGKVYIYDLVAIKSWVAANAPTGYLARRSLGKL